MKIKLHNTLARKKEDFKPLKTGEVSLYTCGLTVYESPQIGNWRGFIFYDTLARTLFNAGYKLNHIWNITDVGHLVGDEDDGEDKLQKTARLKRKTAWEVAEVYTKEFFAGMEALNILTPTKMPKATDHITEQIELVVSLENKGLTYVIDDGVYFDTSKLNDYGKLAGLDIVQQREGARVDANPQKRNPRDFALWKFSPSDQQRDMEWDSPWGKGFPGWHIECSAMAIKYLGETIDIHAGGVDHIGVHHTNEIAQSEAATGKTFANYWMHNEFLLVEGQKMSKSLNNFHTIEDIKNRGFDPLAYRLLVLQAHYRSQLNFTWESLTAAQNFLCSIEAFADLQFQPSDGAQTADFGAVIGEITEALSDDLNTPKSLALLSNLADSTDAVNALQKNEFIDFLKFIDAVLGLKLSTRTDIDVEQKQLIKERDLAKSSNDYTKADALRVKLTNQGIALRDTKYGTLWHKGVKVSSG